MLNLRQRIETAFRDHGLRCTSQRFFLMQHLTRQPVHASAEEIFAAVNRSYPRISRATVYNNLHALEKARLVKQVPMEGKAARYDSHLERHHHFICDTCGAVEDVPWFAPPQIGRDIRDFEVIFRGACEGCLASKDAVIQKGRPLR